MTLGGILHPYRVWIVAGTLALAWHAGFLLLLKPSFRRAAAVVPPAPGIAYLPHSRGADARAEFEPDARTLWSPVLFSLPSVAPMNTPCCQSRACVTSGTVVLRRPPNRIAEIGTPCGSSHSGASVGH